MNWYDSPLPPKERIPSGRVDFHALLVEVLEAYDKSRAEGEHRGYLKGRKDANQNLERFIPEMVKSLHREAWDAARELTKPDIFTWQTPKYETFDDWYRPMAANGEAMYGSDLALAALEEAAVIYSEKEDER